jgi:hypothetical protein
MLQDWEHALAGFRQLVPIAVVQPAPEPVPAPSLETAPKTSA